MLTGGLRSMHVSRRDARSRSASFRRLSSLDPTSVSHAFVLGKANEAADLQSYWASCICCSFSRLRDVRYSLEHQWNL
jgi:hypothetical protein